MQKKGWTKKYFIKMSYGPFKLYVTLKGGGGHNKVSHEHFWLFKA